MSSSLYQMTSKHRPSPKSARPTHAQRRAERERELSAQADRLYSDLFTALANGNRGFAHRVLDKMVDLRGEYLDVIATAQTEAGEEAQAFDWNNTAA